MVPVIGRFFTNTTLIKMGLQTPLPLKPSLRKMIIFLATGGLTLVQQPALTGVAFLPSPNTVIILSLNSTKMIKLTFI